jgi:hypothetical protein
MSLVSKAYSVSDNTDKIIQELIGVVVDLKAGKSPSTEVLKELLNAGNLVSEASAIPADYASSQMAVYRTVVNGALDLAQAITGVK